MPFGICGEKMILISHRGNISGPNPSRENTTSYIQESIDAGFSVEIDLWIEKVIFGTRVVYKFFLGHDTPQHETSYEWLHDRRSKLWIHAKNLECLYYFRQAPPASGWNFFWHQEDEYTLTNNCLIWTYPGHPLTDRSICVMPEKSDYEKKEVDKCVGICSDYIKEYV